MPGKGKNKQQKQKQPQNERRPHVNENQRPVPAQQEWTVVERPKRREHKRRTQDLLIQLEDNEAQRAWRGRGPHSHTITIPPDLILTGDRQEYQEIAQQYGAHVGPLPTAGNHVYGIWGGTNEKAAAARQALHTWVQSCAESKAASGKSKFGKLQSMTDAQLIKLERRWLSEVQRHEYRQAPAIGSAFEKIGTFHWPVEEMDPQEVLGNSLEALDAIRVDCKCHIILDDEDGLIRILGNDDDVTTAVVRIRHAFFQIIARQHRPLKAHLVHWQDPTVIPAAICPLSFAWSDPFDLLEGTHTGARFEVQSWEDGDSDLHDQTTKQLHSMVMHAISRLRYYSGDITFRIQLGTFVASDFRNPKNEQYYLVDEFTAMLDDSRFAGEVIPEVNGQVKNMLKTIMNDEDVLPRDLGTADAADVRPSKQARFRFSVEGTIYELFMCWQEELLFDGSVRMDRTSTKWVRLDLGQAEYQQLLNVNLIKLDTDMAWNFEIHGAQVVPQWRLPEHLKTFTSRVKLNVKQDRDTPFVVFIAGGTGLISLATSMTYAFQLKNSDWRLDVSLAQQWRYGELKLGVSSKPVQVSRPRWLVQMHHAAWEGMLAENSALTVGTGAQWSSKVQIWFLAFIASDDYDQNEGFDEMLQKMAFVERLLSSKVDRHTGMRID